MKVPSILRLSTTWTLTKSMITGNTIRVQLLLSRLVSRRLKEWKRGVEVHKWVSLRGALLWRHGGGRGELYVQRRANHPWNVASKPTKGVHRLICVFIIKIKYTLTIRSSHLPQPFLQTNIREVVADDLYTSYWVHGVHEVPALVQGIFAVTALLCFVAEIHEVFNQRIQ